MAHPGDAREADSQMFISLSAQPKWNGQYTVFGQVISGMDVVRKLAVTDRLVRVTLRPAPAAYAPASAGPRRAIAAPDTSRPARPGTHLQSAGRAAPSTSRR